MCTTQLCEKETSVTRLWEKKPLMGQGLRCERAGYRLAGKIDRANPLSFGIGFADAWRVYQFVAMYCVSVNS